MGGSDLRFQGGSSLGPSPCLNPLPLARLLGVLPRMSNYGSEFNLVDRYVRIGHLSYRTVSLLCLSVHLAGPGVGGGGSSGNSRRAGQGSAVVAVLPGGRP